MNAESMDWCPVCEIVTTYLEEECATCGRLWGIDYTAADIEDRLRHETAERIADRIISQYGLAGENIDYRDALTRAALAAQHRA